MKGNLLRAARACGRAMAPSAAPARRGSLHGVSTPARLEVGVVGAGRVGAVLGAALQRVGHRVVAVSGVSEVSRDRAARLLPGAPVLDPADVVRRAELVLLAVPDDSLTGLVAGLAAT